MINGSKLIVTKERSLNENENQSRPISGNKSKSCTPCGKDGTVLYSNKAGESLLHEWGVGVGEKLPSNIGDIVQRVISRNSPEKMEVKVGKRVYLTVFHPFTEEKCVNIYGFDISDQKELEEKFRKVKLRKWECGACRDH